MTRIRNIKLQALYSYKHKRTHIQQLDMTLAEFIQELMKGKVVLPPPDKSFSADTIEIATEDWERVAIVTNWTQTAFHPGIDSVAFRVGP